MMGDMYSALCAAVGAADKVVELMQRVPQVPPGGTLQPAACQGKLEFDNVTFSYPARPGKQVGGAEGAKTRRCMLRA